MERMYPDSVPPFPREPLKSDFAFITTPEFGEGIISRRHFKAGETVFAFSGRINGEQSLYSLQIAPGVYIHDPYVMGKVLHNCEPNMSCDMETCTFTAERDICPGEYLTMDYESTEDILYRPFECGCPAQHCRGLIRGRLFSMPQPQMAQELRSAA